MLKDLFLHIRETKVWRLSDTEREGWVKRGRERVGEMHILISSLETYGKPSKPTGRNHHTVFKVRIIVATG